MLLRSQESQTIWRELMGLSSAVGEVRARVTRLEREQDQRNWQATLPLPTATPSGPAETAGRALWWKNVLFRMKEGLSVVVLIYKVWRAAPWSLIVLSLVSVWKWGWPLLLRWLGLA